MFRGHILMHHDFRRYFGFCGRGQLPPSVLLARCMEQSDIAAPARRMAAYKGRHSRAPIRTYPHCGDTPQRPVRVCRVRRCIYIPGIV